ncbi:16S rRNA (adenine(1518)-N(6)/adenine(1519)-N(6))-dimethyltransferase RsmA [Nonomuraea zeae]|uniref:Ribosomal RNA small subunit methyltransferase A n=1 Tax=Nonomuraea zeae TaxID=1642303 RepID=A0A5S4G158_9ACTN|nr:rRNA adenine dimethyltransferase family protein [Nonomuraea zeae]TMR26592.1 16S rRNA (adenine(1518)-N(6)/adenine(1519)-N(6))-dimethyltransferase RsmA [Nonomuraea zeae]
MRETGWMMRLLGPAEIRILANKLDLRPTKKLGQNFVIDAGTVRRIVRVADLSPDDVVIEVGPGLGSLTLALLPPAEHVVAVEIDPVLARQLPITVAERAATDEHAAGDEPAEEDGGAAEEADAADGRTIAERNATHKLTIAGRGAADKLTVVNADAMKITLDDLEGHTPTALVANLPYNVAVPVVLHLLEVLPSLRKGLIMVQLEVADRLAAGPGSKVYGVPSVKAAWYADVRRAGPVGRTVFWPVPNVDSGLVSLTRREPPETTASREEVFAVVDAAFAQRRKTLRAALASWAGSPALSEEALRAAGVNPSARGEELDITSFARIAEAKP